MKRIISILISTLMIFSIVSLGFAEDNKLEELNSEGIIEKLDDGTFGLDNVITRGELVKIAIKLLEIDNEVVENDNVYTDIKSDNPLNKYISIACKKNLINGYEDGTFRPSKPITYGEFITVMIRVLGQEPRDGIWPQNYIKVGEKLGLINNIKDPNKTIKGKEAYNIIYKVFDRLKLKIAMVTDLGGINDASFNQLSWEGLKKVGEDFDVNIGYAESMRDSDYIENLNNLKKDNNDLIFGIGYKLAWDTLKQAKSNPKVNYGLIDVTVEDIPKNMTCVLFKTEEGSFLAGYLAAKMTETNKIGFVGGMEGEIIDTFHYGYIAGAKYGNPNIEIVVEYADTFADAERGKEIANKMYDNGVDIIFHAAGGTGNGVIESAKKNDTYVIGVDRDQSYLAPENVLTSVIKKIDEALYDVSKEFINGTLKGGNTLYYGIRENGIGLSKTTSKLVPKDILEDIEKVKDKISSGEIVVPKNQREYTKFLKNK